MASLFSKNPNENKLKYISVSKILPNRSQPRKNFDEKAIKGLAESIRSYGVIQPISVRRCGNDYELIAGERRLRAAKLAGLSEIPCILLRASDKSSGEMALIENLQREGLDMFEEATAIEKLLCECGCTQTELAEKLSMSQSALANKLRLLRFDAEQRALIRKFGVPERSARAFLRLPPESRKEHIIYAAEKKLSANEIETSIDKTLCGNIIRDAAKKQNARDCGNPGTFRKKEPVKDLPQTAAKQENKPSEQKNAPIRSIIIGDLNLFYNSVSHAVNLLKTAGYDAEMTKSETDGEICISILIK